MISVWACVEARVRNYRTWYPTILALSSLIIICIQTENGEHFYGKIKLNWIELHTFYDTAQQSARQPVGRTVGRLVSVYRQMLDR